MSIDETLTDLSLYCWRQAHTVRHRDPAAAHEWTRIGHQLQDFAHATQRLTPPPAPPAAQSPAPPTPAAPSPA